MKKNGGDQMDTLKILVVDDESRMRKLVKDFLTKKNFQVLEAGNGEEAMDIFYEEKDIALIILDVMMPKMDGFETARQIRRVPHKDAQMIPIIAMSAKDAREDMDACKEAGMNDYLAKPVEPQRLYQVLAEYLENPM